MKLFPQILALYIPMFIRKKGLQELFRITADAFNCSVPDLKKGSYNECLFQYALFTKEQVEKSVQNGSDMIAIQNKLYKNAYQTGEKIRKMFSINNPATVMATCKIFYKTLGIDFVGTAQGEITMKECFFSQVYSPYVCFIISSLDEGIISGLSGDVHLTFSQRITEGGESCRAHLSKPILKS